MLSFSKETVLCLATAMAIISFYFRSHSMIGRFASVQEKYSPRQSYHEEILTRYNWNSSIDFPMPSFHGCAENDRGLCKFSNVCFSNVDGMLVFDVPNLLKEWFSANGSEFQNANPGRRPTLIPKVLYETMENVFFTRKMLVVNCLQLPSGFHNPVHLLFGHGDLFVHSYGHNRSDPYSLVLYHQCPPSTGWPWAEKIDKMIWDDAINNGAVRNESGAQLFLPFPANGVLSGAKLAEHLKNGDVICGQTVYQEPLHVGHFFGSNRPEDIERWRKVSQTSGVTNSEHLMKKNNISMTLSASSLAASTTCAQNLRFAVWKRNEGSSLRLLTNIDDIERLVGEHSSIPLSVISMNSSTPFTEQVSTFESSFDVLITPHGSHLVNMIFCPSDQVAFIELQSVFYDGCPMTNGQSFAKSWILSLGHLPLNRPDLVDKMGLCSEPGACDHSTMTQFIHSDLIVNTTILRENLEEVVSVLCPKDVNLHT